MLVGDIMQLTTEWDLDDPNSYGSKMVSGSSHEALGKMLRGASNLAISELLYERLSDPYLTRDRKDEESCFSENTYVDLVANARGVENVYLGRYRDLAGPSLSDLVKAKNPDLDTKLRQQLAAARAAVEAIPQPFDHAVLEPDSSEGRMKVKAAIDALGPLRDDFIAVATTLDLPINLR